MTRWWIVCYLDKFYTKVSGDIAGEGEFYFKCNGKRFPDKGVIKLKKNETFDPEPNPILFSALLEDKDKEVKFDVEVWEEDPGRDDKFIDQEFKIKLAPMNEKKTLMDKKQKCQLDLVIKIEEAKNW